MEGNDHMTAHIATHQGVKMTRNSLFLFFCFLGFFLVTFTLHFQIQNEEKSFASGIKHSISPPLNNLFIHSLIDSFIHS